MQLARLYSKKVEGELENKEEKTELAKMLNQGMDERVEFLGQLFLISNF